MPDGKGAYAHLPLPLVIKGIPKLRGFGGHNPRTKENRENRVVYGGLLKQRTSELSRFWKEKQHNRISKGLPELNAGIPVLLQIDPESDVDFLRGLGFEIVTELEDGFVIVATEDVDFSTLNEKLDKFIIQYNSKSDSPAKIYGMEDDTNRLERILSSDLFKLWPTLHDDQNYIIDIGVECTGKISLPKYPQKKENESEEHLNERLQTWNRNFFIQYAEWDELRLDRENKLYTFITQYDGEICSSIDGIRINSELPDSFTVRLKISGQGLRDLAENFGYIFEITLPDAHESEKVSQNVDERPRTNIELIPPPEEAPIICIMDSGIQEGHKYLQPSIRESDSLCLLKDTDEISDLVQNGGHGTRVAGAVLFPNGVPVEGIIPLPYWIRNIRILNDLNCIPNNISPPYLIMHLVKTYCSSGDEKTKIINHSVASSTACGLGHMSAWAAEIDNQSYENDVLFIQAAGNIPRSIIEAYIKSGIGYPQYLNESLSRISNPSQSLQAITVGSINLVTIETEDIQSLGMMDEPSSFSRSGPGIWDSIKPDVVEYGGTYANNRDLRTISLTTPPEGCPELLRVSPEGPVFARDCVGTSFSAPKVSNIALQIQSLFPDSSCLLYRALIAQSARWPEWTRRLPASSYSDIFRHIGYGLPDVIRATENNLYRVTLITEDEKFLGTREAHIYKVNIPRELREIGEDTEILIEVTLSYAAKPRRTRRTIKRYLSTWLEWESSNMREDPETFKRRILQENHSIDDDGSFSWTLGHDLNRGQTKDISRGKSTLQKDWTIVKSNELGNAFCIAVRGHEGWGAAFKAKYCLAVSFEAIHQDIPIYEPIRTAITIEVEASEEEIQIPVSE